jgi:hypothetical protein
MNKRLNYSKKHSKSKHLQWWTHWLLLLISFYHVKADQIVFSEIMYHPRHEAESAWIECVNLTSTPLDCAEWTLEGKSLDYTFPKFDRATPRASFIKPFERILITDKTPAAFREQYQIPGHIRIWGPWKGKLELEKEKLALKDKNGIGLCQLNFKNDTPWPIEASGAGYSMVIRHPDRTVNHWNNWKASSKPGGSPGITPFPKDGIQFQLKTTNSEFNRELMIPMEVTWRYHQGTSQVNRNWIEPNFDDNNWKMGEGLLGFEESNLPSPGIRTRLTKGPLSYYFRTQFVVSELLTDGYLEINQVLDDGAVYYLNGKEIGTSRMSKTGNRNNPNATATESVTDAVLEESVIRINGEQLRQGVNVLAVEVHQNNSTSTDLVFGAELWAITRYASLPLNLVEIGVTHDSKGYVIVENTSDIPRQIAHYWITAADDLNQAPRTIAYLPTATLIPNQRQQFPLDRRISMHSLVSISKRNERKSALTVPLQLPGSGYRQRLTNPDQNIWQVESIQASSNQIKSKLNKGNLWISEVHFSEDGTQLSLELSHSHSHDISLTGLALAHQSTLDQPLALKGNLEENALKVIEYPGIPKEKKRLKLFLLDRETQVVLDAVSVENISGKSLQRLIGKQHEWFISDFHTLGATNTLFGQKDIIINEIMFDPPYGQDDLEFIELHNKGSEVIPLDHWKLDDGIEYDFPIGTRLKPGNHLAIAKNPEALTKHHPDINCIGPFKGKLGNDGERIQLLDQNGNLADAVNYRSEGDWPELARGKGSSMELLHPESNNSHSSAWKDSRESRSSEFKKFHFTTRYQGLMQMWHPMDHQELHLYLVGESHVVLRNIQFRKKGQSKNLISNPDRISIEGDSSTGWLIQGNHGDSFIENGRLHLIAHGHGDNRANRAEIDITELKNGESYEIEFEARWVHGSPRLIMRTWENSLSESILLPISERLGTPGQPNSTLRSIPSPIVENLQHFPSVPAPLEPLTIKAQVGWPRAPGTVNLVYRIDGKPDSPWNRIPMQPSQASKEPPSSLIPYEILLDKSFNQGDLIQYYVEAIPDRGLRTTLPRKPASQPALCIFDGRLIPNDLRVIRLLISDYHMNSIPSGGSEDYRYRYPRLSNQYFNSTFISNDKDIYHGAELRASGSPWTRQNSMDRGKFRLPKDRLFRDQGKFAFDNDPTRNRGAVRHHNRIARYLLYLLGHVSGQNEFVYVIINAGNPQVKEDVEPVDADYLKRNFKDGNQGELYRVDDDWWMSDHWSQSNRDASWNYFNTDHPALYRHSWMKRSKEEEDDYTELIDFFKLINRRNYTQAEVESILDSDAILKMTAVLGFIADWDTFTQARGKNAYFYQRPDDRKFQLLHWDADLAFGGRRHNSFYGGSQQFSRWVEKPYNFPKLIKYLNQIVSLTRDSQGRVEAWMHEESQGNPHTKIDTPFYRNFFKNRNQQVERLK